MSGDSQAASVITDHPFEPRDPSKPWGLCRHCGLSEAAHRDTVVSYTQATKKLGLEYRCPRCVQTDNPICCHSPEQIDAFIKGEEHSPEEAVEEG